VLSPDFYLMVYIHTSRIKIEKVLDIKGGYRCNRLPMRILGLTQNWYTIGVICLCDYNLKEISQRNTKGPLEWFIQFGKREIKK